MDKPVSGFGYRAASCSVPPLEARLEREVELKACSLAKDMGRACQACLVMTEGLSSFRLYGSPAQIYGRATTSMVMEALRTPAATAPPVQRSGNTGVPQADGTAEALPLIRRESAGFVSCGGAAVSKMCPSGHIRCPPRKQRLALSGPFPQALCRTRTDDPLLTIEV